MTTPNPTWLDEILAKLNANSHDVLTPQETIILWPELKEAKQQILQTIDAAIGADDFIVEPSGNSRIDQQVQSEIDGANKLRAKLREQLGISHE